LLRCPSKAFFSIHDHPASFSSSLITVPFPFSVFSRRLSHPLLPEVKDEGRGCLAQGKPWTPGKPFPWPVTGTQPIQVSETGGGGHLVLQEDAPWKLSITILG
jgi:hypothetical protein